ncbi:MAG: hypothetical protein ACTSRA_17745 [Promethearchaeota archaeon]
MGFRKLGIITGILMLILLFFAGYPPVEFWILRVPSTYHWLYTGGGLDKEALITFYIWGFYDGSSYHNLLTLKWPSCFVAWLTIILYMAATAFTISASTPGSVVKNAKRFFSLSSAFCFLNIVFYILILVFSSFIQEFYYFLGPGFYALLLFAISNLISLKKVE